jgi:hypothetical protein
MKALAAPCGVKNKQLAHNRVVLLSTAGIIQAQTLCPPFYPVRNLRKTEFCNSHLFVPPHAPLFPSYQYRHALKRDWHCIYVAVADWQRK